jgi:hypothetical protein
MFSPGDSPVWIYGDFPETDDDLHVMFGDQECTNVTLVDNETITCNSPAGMWSRLFFFLLISSCLGTGAVPICVLVQKRGCYKPPATFTYFGMSPLVVVVSR